MDSLGLPIRIDGRGWLVRSDRKKVLVDLLRAIALTPDGTWAPDPEFGLRNYFESPERAGALRRREWNVGLPQKAIDALNRSLERLGVNDFTVSAIEKVAADSPGEIVYAVKVVGSGRGAEILELRL